MTKNVVILTEFCVLRPLNPLDINPFLKSVSRESFTHNFHFNEIPITGLLYFFPIAFAPSTKKKEKKIEYKIYFQKSSKNK